MRVDVGKMGWREERLAKGRWWDVGHGGRLEMVNKRGGGCKGWDDDSGKNRKWYGNK